MGLYGAGYGLSLGAGYTHDAGYTEEFTVFMILASPDDNQQPAASLQSRDDGSPPIRLSHSKLPAGLPNPAKFKCMVIVL